LLAAGRVSASDADRRAALLAREIREQLPNAIGEASACSSCSVGCAAATESSPGDHCRGGNTEDILADHELVGLALAGTRARHLKPPATAHVGCAFRGLDGCMLEAAHRPDQCLLHTCRDPRRELSRRGDPARVQQLIGQLEASLSIAETRLPAGS
jgi:hypothetical protein